MGRLPGVAEDEPSLLLPRAQRALRRPGARHAGDRHLRAGRAGAQVEEGAVRGQRVHGAAACAGGLAAGGLRLGLQHPAPADPQVAAAQGLPPVDDPGECQRQHQPPGGRVHDPAAAARRAVRPLRAGHVCRAGLQDRPDRRRAARGGQAQQRALRRERRRQQARLPADAPAQALRRRLAARLEPPGPALPQAPPAPQGPRGQGRVRHGVRPRALRRAVLRRRHRAQSSGDVEEVELRHGPGPAQAAARHPDPRPRAAQVRRPPRLLHLHDEPVRERGAPADYPPPLANLHRSVCGRSLWWAGWCRRWSPRRSVGSAAR